MGNCNPRRVPPAEFAETTSTEESTHEYELRQNQAKALREAVQQNDTGLVHQLLEEEGADPNVQMQWGFTALHFAAEGAHDAMVKTLLDAGGDPNICCDNLHGGFTPLFIACSSVHNCDIVATLVKGGADVNVTDSWGNSPLLKATYCRCNDCVTLLLQNNANPNIYNRWNYSPLHQVARTQDTDMLKLLIDSGSDVNHLGDKFSHPSLFLVAQRNDQKGMRMLLDAGADYKTRIQLTNVWPSDVSLLSYLVLSCGWYSRWLYITYDVYPHCIEDLINLGINVTEETQSYITLNLRDLISYNRRPFYVSVLELVLKSQGFEYNSNVLRTIYTNILKRNDKPVESEQFLPLMLTIGLAPTQEHAKFIEEASSVDDKLTLLRFFRENPRKLKDICRLKIRLCISENVPYKCKRLPLPKNLQDYVTIVSPCHFSTWENKAALNYGPLE